MKNSNLIIVLFFLFTLLSCEKENNKTESLDNNYQLTVSRNDKIYQFFKFNDKSLLYQLNYDTSGILKEKIYFTYSSQFIKKECFNKDSALQYSMIYKLNTKQNIDSVFVYNQPSNDNDYKHAFLFSYSESGNLSLIMDKVFPSGEHFDINFQWAGNNVIEKNFPFNSGYPQYSYEYDNNPSIYKLLNAPVDVNIGKLEVAEIPLSNNNIKKVKVKKLVNNDLTFDTVNYELYNSQMTYDIHGFLRTEIRKYSNITVKYDYKLDTIK